MSVFIKLARRGMENIAAKFKNPWCEFGFG